MDKRKIESEKRKLKKIEQILRSKIWPDLLDGGDNIEWRAVKEAVIEWKKDYLCENGCSVDIDENLLLADFWEFVNWEREDVIEFLKINLIVIYGRFWGLRLRVIDRKKMNPSDKIEKIYTDDQNMTQKDLNLTLTLIEKKESVRLTEILIYWHLGRELSEREKFQALLLIEN